LRKDLLLILITLFASSIIMVKTDKLKPSLKSEEGIPLYKYQSLILTFPSLRNVVADFIYMELCYLTGTGGFDLKNKKEIKKEIESEKNLSKEDWSKLIQNLYVVHKLDPYYFDPYYLEAAYISWMVKGDRKLIERINSNLIYGLNHLKDWRIPFFLGFNYFYFLDNKVLGAKYLKLAAQMKGSPYYIKLLVPRLYAESGKIDMAIAVVKEELANAKSEALRNQLKRRLKALEYIKYLNLVLQRFKNTFGYCPKDVSELKKVGFLTKIPDDPYGGKFYITEKCSVWTTSNLRGNHH